MAWACAASRRTSGGISRPRRRTRPFTAFREPILVIVIFPYFASGGVRRGSGGGDVRASPRTGLSSSTPVVASYISPLSPLRQVSLLFNTRLS